MLTAGWPARQKILSQRPKVRASTRPSHRAAPASQEPLRRSGPQEGSPFRRACALRMLTANVPPSRQPRHSPLWAWPRRTAWGAGTVLHLQGEAGGRRGARPSTAWKETAEVLIGPDLGYLPLGFWVGMIAQLPCGVGVMGEGFRAGSGQCGAPDQARKKGASTCKCAWARAGRDVGGPGDPSAYIYGTTEAPPGFLACSICEFCMFVVVLFAIKKTIFTHFALSFPFLVSRCLD